MPNGSALPKVCLADRRDNAAAMRLSFEQVLVEVVGRVVGVRAVMHEPARLRNAQACLQALNLQEIPRWRYRIVLVEQDGCLIAWNSARSPQGLMCRN